MRSLRKNELRRNTLTSEENEHKLLDLVLLRYVVCEPLAFLAIEPVCTQVDLLVCRKVLQKQSVGVGIFHSLF